MRGGGAEGGGGASGERVYRGRLGGAASQTPAPEREGRRRVARAHAQERVGERGDRGEHEHARGVERVVERQRERRGGVVAGEQREPAEQRRLVAHQQMDRLAAALLRDLLIDTTEITAAVRNTTEADARRNVGSNNTSGCGSHVPGKV